MATLSEEYTPYHGPERRRNRVYRTQNSEYYCREDVCIAVRNRQTGDFIPHHRAIGLRMSGGIAFSKEGEMLSFTKRGEVPQRGENLFFSETGNLERSVRTSALTEVTRPPAD